jgi:spermidine/putrescine transport system permease protein
MGNKLGPADWFFRGFALLIYVFLFAPILVVVMTSFNPTGRATIPTEFTLRWYSDLLNDSQLMTALWTSLTVALVAGVGSAILGLSAAYGLSRYRMPGRGAAQGIFYLPMLVPAVVSGVSMLMWYRNINIQLGWVSIILTHIVVTLPFTMTIILTSFAGFDMRLEEAAMDLGASPWRTFRGITLPIVMPGVLGGALMAFTLSFDEFVVTLFVSGGGVQTLPIVVYNRIRYMLSPEINAIATLVMGFSMGLLIIGQLALLIRRRQERARTLQTD